MYIMTVRDRLRNPKDFTDLEYPPSQMKLKIQLIHILSQKVTDIVLEQQTKPKQKGVSTELVITGILGHHQKDWNCWI